MDLARMTRSGLLVRLAHGVYRDAGAPSDEYEALRAAWLSTEPSKFADERLEERQRGVLVSGASAAELHRIGDLRTERHEFTSSKRRQTQRPELHFRQRDLKSSDVTVVEGIPATTIERTIVDLVDTRTDLSLVADALRDASLRTRLNVEQLSQGLDPLAGRNGFARGGGEALLAHLTSLAGLDVSTLAQQIGATDELAYRVSINVLNRMATERLLSGPQMESLQSALRLMNMNIGQQLSASLQPSLKQFAMILNTSAMPTVEVGKIAHTLDAIAKGAQSSRPPIHADDTPK